MVLLSEEKRTDNTVFLTNKKYDMSYYVLSLSENCDDLAMWQMYAKSGCCIKFNSQNLLKFFHNIRDKHFLYGMYNICYGQIQYDENLEREAYDLLQMENQKSKLEINLYDFIWRWCLLNKCNSFTYEKEFRIAIPYSPEFSMNGESYKFIIRDNYIKPQIEFNDFPVADVIEEIIISPYINTQLTKMGILELLKSENMYNTSVCFSNIQIQ